MVPFIRPAPPSLLGLGDELRDIEASGIHSNYGPVNSRFEQAMQETMFADGGACVTVCNATIGLMMAMRAVIERARAGSGSLLGRGERRYALMPSFTFAAAAQAADWIGLTPLFCDIDADDWAASASAEEAMIAQYGANIAVIVPYATFGSCIDLARYEALSARTGIPVVVDGAASLGSLDGAGRAFGAFSHLPVVFSMHATKTFSTGEGGVIHSADPELVQILRVMGNFGFGSKRSATMPGLNAKMSEVGALLALAQLEQFEGVVAHRETLAEAYRAALPGWTFQEASGLRCAHQFMPVLLPVAQRGMRDMIVTQLAARGIGTGTYFSPHVAAQPYFMMNGFAGDLSVTERISAQILCLPLWNAMTVSTVHQVCDALHEICRPFVDRADAVLQLPGRMARQPDPGRSIKSA